ncbi:hypothetical protein JDV02_005247 [Purpureocillium takamizusanense]|uniref:Uncharacterized protein n=1 Tax=Purpureocillium takamizusanense TaxID=2060973 RepID=A0A9Q8QFL0_9HYPO|nr:uncharacterized protein JDV02_005247 [Purpureocillium takamizusanense]UNI19028.1 hypothetical protein JDV02_005247 [Purpureocillium takamizusanense]
MPRSIPDETGDSLQHNGATCTETSPLLHGQTPTAPSYCIQEVQPSIEPHHERPVLSPERLTTTWRREVTTIAAWSVPLLMTQMLQRAINFVSIFIVGRLGTRELGAVSCG